MEIYFDLLHVSPAFFNADFLSMSHLTPILHLAYNSWCVCNSLHVAVSENLKIIVVKNILTASTQNISFSEPRG